MYRCIYVCIWKLTYTHAHAYLSIKVFPIKYRHALWSGFFQPLISVDKCNIFPLLFLFIFFFPSLFLFLSFSSVESAQ